MSTPKESELVFSKMMVQTFYLGQLIYSMLLEILVLLLSILWMQAYLFL